MTLPLNNSVLAASELYKRYGDTQALNGVSLTVEAGQICAVLGQNGAGKTTLIHCALGLTQPSQGEVSVMGLPAGSQAAKQATGVMLQDTDLPDLLTAREHLTLYSSYFNNPENIDTLIDYAGIRDFANKRYKALSGGQKRRVQFAVALIGQPKLLFLDEPTTGLDQDARNAVWANVRRLAESGTTVILTTHYLEEADALADRIVVINKGRVIADDSTGQVREQVGGAFISCQTTIQSDVAQNLPAVRSASMRGRLLNIASEDAAKTLAAMLSMDPELSELNVRKPSLEEAFSLLTAQTQETH